MANQSFSNIIEYIKRNINLPDYVESLSDTKVRWSRNDDGAVCNCPMSWHKDRNASFHMTKMDDNIWIYHCLAGDTRVITKDGVFNIKILAGTKQEVLNSNGQWVVAPFYSFGKQVVSKIVLYKNGHKKEIKATNEHRWFVKNDKEENIEKTTGSLKISDILSCVFPKNNFKKRKGWSVKTIERNVGIEEVFCAVVDKTHSFTLEDNILTGNCFGCHCKGDVIKFYMEYTGEEDFRNTINILAKKLNIDSNMDLSAYEYNCSVKRVNKKKELENANIIVSNQCRLLLRRDFDKYKLWVSNAYKRMNVALDEENAEEIEKIGYEAFRKFV